jgi:hypothetical protein
MLVMTMARSTTVNTYTDRFERAESTLENRHGQTQLKVLNKNCYWHIQLDTPTTATVSENCCMKMTHASRFKYRNLKNTSDYGNFISYMPQAWVYYKTHT